MRQKKQLEPPNHMASDELSDIIRECHLVVTSFDRWSCPSEEKCHDFTIGDCELLYVIRGKMKFTCEGVSYPCEPGSLVFLQPLTEYQVDFSGSDALEYYYIHFDVDPIHQLERLRANLFGEKGPVFEPTELPRMGFILDTLYDAMQKKQLGYYAMTVAELIRILVVMCRSRQGENGLPMEFTPSMRELQIVNEAILYIDQHLAQPLRVTEISEHVGVSENYLYKSFVNVIKLPPSKYILQHKVKQAEKYLKSGSYSVNEIARMLGFSSLFHFSKTFKDYFGVSPKQYVKSNVLK